MKTTAALVILSAAAAQAAITFEQFPAKGVTCPNSDASGQLTSDTAALKAAAEAAKDGKPYEQSASNISSGACSSLKLPYFITTTNQANGEPAANLSFAWDEANETIYYCGAQGLFSTNGSGYPDSCDQL
ncbi:hypothetical protein BFW01_g6926 [Lasiodiplodia theobromae]|uniref:Uncharacterized protein n=1 Tax=Lasiodiplodia theobromae TaxID=45133 RepID=A0A5N5DTF4_9PEZI|nr:uncharacterized protein LTHEOB_11724 [Lasiodiplodia theobromae]KAB2580970.1 hypothetical protein DBV05_g400 [Lasiodiplodia theobromae]KAF4537015.1 hypothetical protein LTHEOB_11724 [Lasiodiplodia theobromae]KAF9636031.1 hypothetical protein BFW01_g6926 [Lasiodiplodia theobromae]